MNTINTAFTIFILGLAYVRSFKKLDDADYFYIKVMGQNRCLQMTNYEDAARCKSFQ